MQNMIPCPSGINDLKSPYEREVREGGGQLHECRKTQGAKGY